MSKEYLSDIEKRILFAAISREKKFCIDKVDSPSELVKICNRLEHCFMYDRIFKDLEKETYNKAIDDYCNRLCDNGSIADFMKDYFRAVAKDLKGRSENE